MTRKRVTGFMLGAAVLAGGLACTDSGGSLVVLYNRTPERALATCAASASEGSFLPSGTLDLIGGKGYTLTPLIQNNATAGTGGALTRSVFLTGADTKLEPGLTDDSEALVAALGADRSQRQLFTGIVAAGGGLAAVPYQVITDAQATALKARVAAGQSIQIVAATKVRGDMDGGDVTSSEFRYPITLCHGCLVPREPDATVCAAFQYQDVGFSAPLPDAAPPDAAAVDAGL